MKVKKIIITVLLVIVAVFAGILIGAKSHIVSGALDATAGLYVPADLAAEHIDMKQFWDVWRELEARHPDGETVTAETKLWGAIQGLTDSLGDPYTTFLPPKENESLAIDLAGKFSGVGMEVGMKDGALTVVAPLKDSPAERAGILSGDIILKIDDTSVAGLDVDRAVELIRGKEGTTVMVTIARKDGKESKDISIVREVIKIPVIETEYLKNDDVFLIRFFQFGENSSKEFEKALTAFQESGSNRLIVDVRNNPGGYLSAAINISSWFLPEGEVIVSEKSKNPVEDKSYTSLGHHISGDYKLVILVNGGSASASEIMAGALQEQGVAKLVGTQTFGKGSVQELIPMNGKTALKMTVAKWYTPKGVSISEKGLTPDVVVEFDADKYKKDKTDTQLQKAIETVKSL
jgi:carboxyl-terminal processing protease